MPMADVKVTDAVSGKKFNLNSLMKGNGLLVIFSSNTCPYVIAWEHTYSELSRLGKISDVGTVLINSNEAFRGSQDTPESMAEKARDQRYNMPYLVDPKHRIADAFGARTTPHVFLFDGNGKLVYKGAIDDRYESGKNSEPQNHWLKDAIRNLAEGKAIEPSTSREIGCSIKRVKK